MKATQVEAIAGAYLFEPMPHVDERGFFSRTFDADVARSVGIDPDAFIQDSLSRSAKGVLRGMHLRSGAGEAKLVRCSYGEVLDVIVDLRPQSPTFLNKASFTLTGDSQRSLYVPAGCAHGFQALTEPADVSYRIDRRHDPSEDVAIAYDDPDLAIAWPLPVSLRSGRDAEAGSLADALALIRGSHVVTFKCRGCGSKDTGPVVDLGAQPCADYFPPVDTAGEDPRWPLELWLCRTCTLVQLGPVEPQLPEPPLAIESATSLAHAETSVKEILRDHPEIAGKVVYEFASHHGGSWLGHLQAAGCRIAEGDQRADLVVDVHGIAHEPAVGEMLRLRADRLAPSGLLVLEFHHLLPLVEGNQFDTIRHGHWSYLSLGAVVRLAAIHELVVVSVREVNLFGGSLQVMLRHESAGIGADDSVRDVLSREAAAGIDGEPRLTTLHEHAVTAASALHDLLAGYKADGRSVVAYGAPSKAPVLLDLAKVGPDLLPFTVDASPAKHGRRIPGSGVPIRSVDDLRAAQPDVVLVLTWDIVDEVMSQLEANGAGWDATYVVPLPEPHPVTTADAVTARVIAPVSGARSATPARLGNATGELFSPNDVEGR
jgi:dTDP-4-dehydrorhamnose 3,5-epimerase